MALTKGVGFVNVRAFVTERHGTPAWRQLLEALDPGDRELWVGLVPVGWYDLGAYARLIRALDRLYGSADLGLVRDLGRFEAERDLTTIQRFFLKLVRPSMAIEQTGKYWSRFHDSGRWEMERRGDREVRGVLTGWGVVDEALCIELVSYLARTLELVGGKDVRMDHPRCRVKGADACEFRLFWRLEKDGPGEG
ncbi:MAG: hypothetical protein WKG00_16105 [Polyangiaceae bacterium]